MFLRTLFIAALLIATPFAASAADDDATVLAQIDATIVETGAEMEVEVEEMATSTRASEATPAALFGADLGLSQSWSSCDRPSCNTDRQCGWMRPQCSLHSYPTCVGGTGSGCEGSCECTCS